MDGQVGNITYWVNRDYASSRGFEATLTRRFANNFSGELNYAFGVATGVGPDPNRGLPIDLRLPADFRAGPRLGRAAHVPRPVRDGEPGLGVELHLAVREGVPLHARGRNTREFKPEVINSRRLPSTTGLDVKAEKYYSVWGQRFRVFLDGQNVLDTKNITELEPGQLADRPPGARQRLRYLLHRDRTRRGRMSGDVTTATGSATGCQCTIRGSSVTRGRFALVCPTASEAGV